MLPILERLLYRPAERSMTRVLVLVPTRELAVQVYQVGRQLSQYTKITMCLAAGMYVVTQTMIQWREKKRMPWGAKSGSIQRVLKGASAWKYVSIAD